MMLPLLIRLKVRDDESKGVNLYLPMFLIYLLLLPIVLLVIPIWLLFSLLFLGTEKGKRVFHMLPALYVLVCASRGTEINVEEKNSIVILKIV